MSALIWASFAQLTHAQDGMFSLIRKIPVDHMGTLGQIDGCEFSKDNYYIIASDNHAKAKIYVRETGVFVNQVKHLEMDNVQFERAGKINAVGYSYDRKYFYTGINDHGLKLWDAETYTLVRHFNKTTEVDGADFPPTANGWPWRRIAKFACIAFPISAWSTNSPMTEGR